MFAYELGGFLNLSPRELPISLAKRYCPIRVEPKHGFRGICGAVACMNVPWLMVTWDYDESPTPRRYRRHALL